MSTNELDLAQELKKELENSTPRLADLKTDKKESLSETDFLLFQEKFQNYLKTGILPDGLKDEEALNLYLQGYFTDEERQKLTDESIKHQKLHQDSSPRTKKRGLTFVWETVKTSLITPCKKILTVENAPWDAKSDKDNMEILETNLINGTFAEVMDMREYLNAKKKTAKFAGEVYIVLLNNGTKAVWKPRDGDNINSAVAEVVAFKASKWLRQYSGRYLVPPTVIKTFRGRTGSLQWFVESPFDLWQDTDRAKAYAGLSKEDLASGASFIHVFGQWDTHPGNYLMTRDKEEQIQLALIDNEGIANRKFSRNMTERPFIRIAYGENPDVPPRFITLKTPTKEELQKAWSSFGLNDRRLENLYSWVTANGTQDVDYMIWKNGLWIQHHKRNKSAFPNHVPYYPQYVSQAYQDLTLETLKDIFSLGVEVLPRYFDDTFFQDILMRKEQLLASMKSQMALTTVSSESSASSDALDCAVMSPLESTLDCSKATP